MHKSHGGILIILILLVIVNSIILFVVYYDKNPISVNEELIEVCIRENCFDVEIADSGNELARGLMFREKLDENKGMLFIFMQPANYTFWMKNMFIPLDIIWIDENKAIVHIEENVPICEQDPCQTYTPNKKALYVLEIKSGLVKKLGIKTGENVEF